MSLSHTPFDLTGTVRLDSATAVAGAISRLLAERFPADELNPVFLRRCFEDVEAAFWGEYPGLLRCDTPYHDLRHSLDTALLVARLLDGYQAAPAHADTRLNGREAELAILLALLHDIGFLRRTDEHHLSGAQLVRTHEMRSVEFARRYLSNSPLSEYQDSAELIHVTCFAHDAADVLHGHPEQQKAIARMIGSADLISQISDRCYLERCRDFLYREFATAGVDRIRDATGKETILYLDGEDLLLKTPGFYEHLVRKRLEEDYQNIQQVLTHHFGDRNPYFESMQSNLSYLQQLIDQNQLHEGLRRHPVPLLPGDEVA